MANIRRAGPSDFIEVARLDREAWTESRHATFIPDGEHAWRLWVEHAIVFVVEEDADLVGAALAFPTQAASYCLHKIFVERSRRGQGLGGDLMGAALRELESLGVPCFLTVDPVNEAAISLYENWGFSERTFVKGYYRPEEDRLVMTKPAPGA
ncbi:MAG: hypothetical protein CME26_13555 [Gemmatimonadetes bacterium]|nr:hypothetical protein [Gemmatimonadota bacterium]|tara:strand:- start:4482 stop:4940 length:459 start_codon:yes stop_codon:yes gene_type:complete